MAYLQIQDQDAITHVDFSQLKTQKSIPIVSKAHFTPVASETRMNTKRLKTLVLQAEKSNRDAKVIYNEIKDFNFFTFLYDQQNFQEDDMIHMCKYLNYESHKAGSTIYTEGDPIDFKIYLVLSGQLTKAVKKLDYYSAQNISKLKDKIRVLKTVNKVFIPQRHFDPQEPETPTPNLGIEIRAYPMSIKSQEVLTPTSPPALKFSQHRSVDTNPNLSPPSPTKKKKTMMLATQDSKEEIPPIIQELDQTDILKNIHEDSRDNPTARLLGENSDIFEVARTSPQVEKQKSFLFRKRKPTIVSKDKGVVVDTKKAGEYFGEAALSTSGKVRTESIVAITDCELLVIDKESILKMKDQFEDNAFSVWSFLQSCMPGLEKVHSNVIVDNLVHLLEPKRLEKGSILTQEGDKGTYFYIIKEGECEAFKAWTTNIENHHKFKNKEIEEHYGIEKHITEQLKVFVTTPGSFVGEEILIRSDNCYDYTVKVTTSNATVYMIEKNKFALRFPNDVFVGLKKMYENKKVKNEKVYQAKIQFLLEEFDNLHQSNLQSDRATMSDLPVMEVKRSRFVPLGVTSETPELDSQNQSFRNSELPMIKQAKNILTPEEQEIAKRLQQYQRTQAYLIPYLKIGETPRGAEQWRLVKEFHEQTSEIQKYKFDFGDNYDQRKLDILSNHLKRINILREPAPKPVPEKMETLPRGSYEERGEIIAANLLVSSARMWSEGEEHYLKSISSKAVFSPKSMPSPRLSFLSARKEKGSPVRGGHYLGRGLAGNGQRSPISEQRSIDMVKSSHGSNGASVNFGKSYMNNTNNSKIKSVNKVALKPKVIQGVIRKVQK